MMGELVHNAGHYRQEGVGVFDGNGNCLNMAPPPARVPELMGDLFHWVKNCKTHPLVYSCVFHYEFEFIHPFIDCNGRMGRYWQDRDRSEKLHLSVRFWTISPFRIP